MRGFSLSRGFRNKGLLSASRPLGLHLYSQAKHRLAGWYLLEEIPPRLTRMPLLSFKGWARPYNTQCWPLLNSDFGKLQRSHQGVTYPKRIGAGIFQGLDYLLFRLLSAPNSLTEWSPYSERIKDERLQARSSLQSTSYTPHCGWSNPSGLFLTRFFVFFVIPLYQRSGSGDCLKENRNFLSFDLLPKCTAGLGEDLFSIQSRPASLEDMITRCSG